MQAQGHQSSAGMWYKVCLSLLLKATADDLENVANAQFNDDVVTPSKGGGPRGPCLSAKELKQLKEFQEATKGQADLTVKDGIITEKCEQYFGVVPLTEDDEWKASPFNCTFLDMIRMRGRMLRLIARYILDEQAEFFANGTIQARTQTMCAEKLDIGSTTISCALRGKTLCYQAKEGIRFKYPLSFFFTAGSVHPYYIKMWLKRQIIEEDTTNPLSDEALRGLWNKEHSPDISRRWIQKWRNQFGIPPSTDRKQ